MAQNTLLTKYNNSQLEEATFLLNSSISHAIIALDIHGNILLWNEGATRHYGYTAEEMVGKNNIFLLYTHYDIESHRVKSIFDEINKTGSHDGEFEQLRKNGEQFSTVISVTTCKDTAKKHIGYMFISKDITSQKRDDILRAKNETLVEQNRLVTEANRLKSEFLANMSHELRSPLNAIIGFSELMYLGKVGPVSSEHKEYLGDILTSSRHLLQLINDILDLAKIESGRMQLHSEETNINYKKNQTNHRC